MAQSTYPAVIDVAPAALPADEGVNDDLTAHRSLHDLAVSAAVKVETELGVNPKGAYADVATRLNAASPQGAAPTIASAAVIAPVTPVVFVSGVTNVVTITAAAPIATMGGTIRIIPTGIFATTAAGNIALASTAVVGKVLEMTYDPTTLKWYPSY